MSVHSTKSTRVNAMVVSYYSLVISVISHNLNVPIIIIFRSSVFPMLKSQSVFNGSLTRTMSVVRPVGGL